MKQISMGKNKRWLMREEKNHEVPWRRALCVTSISYYVNRRTKTSKAIKIKIANSVYVLVIWRCMWSASGGWPLANHFINTSFVYHSIRRLSNGFGDSATSSPESYFTLTTHKNVLGKYFQRLGERIEEFLWVSQWNGFFSPNKLYLPKKIDTLTA